MDRVSNGVDIQKWTAGPLYDRAYRKMNGHQAVGWGIVIAEVS
jgi:hypothetical protein